MMTECESFGTVLFLFFPFPHLFPILLPHQEALLLLRTFSILHSCWYFQAHFAKKQKPCPPFPCQYIQIHYLLMRAKWYNKVVAPALVGHTTIAKSFPYYESVGTVISKKYSKYSFIPPEKNKLLSTEPMFWNYRFYAWLIEPFDPVI